MARDCGACGMWMRITRHGRATTTGYCTLPGVGRVTKSSDSCRFYVSRAHGGFDESASVTAWERMREGRMETPRPGFGPAFVNTNELRDRAKRERGI